MRWRWCCWVVGVVVVDGAVDIDANKIKAEVGKVNPFSPEDYVVFIIIFRFLVLLEGFHLPKLN